MFTRQWYGEPNAVANAIGYAKHGSRSHDAVVRVYDGAGNVIETQEHKGDSNEWRVHFFIALWEAATVNPPFGESDVGTTEERTPKSVLRVATNRSISYHRPMVRIRLAMSDDCRALAEMRYRFRAETESVSETKSRFVRRCTSWMRKRFRARSCPWRCWVLDDGKRLLGHVCVQLFEKIPNPVKDEPELHAYVTNFYVVPEMRDQGLGKKLLNKALSWCRSRGTDAVILWARPASKSLYRRCGFVAPSDIFELREDAPRRHLRRQFKGENGQLR